MWTKLKTSATDFSATGRYRRRGAKIGLLIAVMMALPGLVAASTYTSASLSGNAQPSGASVANSLSCTWSSVTGHSDSFISTIVSGPSVTFTLNQLEGVTYQYSVDEVQLACSGNDPTDTATLTWSIPTAATCSTTGSPSCTPVTSPATTTLVMETAVQQCTSSCAAATIPTDLNPTSSGGASCTYGGGTGAGGTLYDPAITAGQSVYWVDYDAMTGATNPVGDTTCTTGTVSTNAMTITLWGGTTSETYAWISFGLQNLPTTTLTTEPTWELAYSLSD